MSLFQYNSVIAGWNRAQGGDALAAPDDVEFERMIERSALAGARRP